MTGIMWHFVKEDYKGVPRLANGDGREVRVGEKLEVCGPPKVCHHGLHACPTVVDALNYGGGRLCAVRLGGEVVRGDRFNSDKYAATERTCVAMLSYEDTARLLRRFARLCAREAVSLSLEKPTEAMMEALADQNEETYSEYDLTGWVNNDNWGDAVYSALVDTNVFYAARYSLQAVCGAHGDMSICDRHDPYNYDYDTSIDEELWSSAFEAARDRLAFVLDNMARAAMGLPALVPETAEPDAAEESLIEPEIPA